MTGIKVEHFVYDGDPINWVTQFAAVSRGKDKSNNPEKRYQSLLKEGAGDQPSRPLELEPVAIKVNEDVVNTDIAKYSVIDEVDDGMYILHTNRRAVMKAGIDYEEVELQLPYHVFRITVPKKVWANLVTFPVATIISTSMRVVKSESETGSQCDEMVQMVVGGYDETISYQVSLWKNSDIQEIKDIANVVAENISEEHLNVEPCDVPKFKCIEGNVGIESINYGPVTGIRGLKEYITPAIYTLVDLARDDVIRITTRMPLFVVYHLLTHRELHVTWEYDKNNVWVPDDYSDRFLKSGEEYDVSQIINSGDEAGAREHMKRLGYNKEVYDRHPHFAVMVTCTVTGEADGIGWDHLFKERNVSEPSKSNWTQKETVDILKPMYEKYKQLKGL